MNSIIFASMYKKNDKSAWSGTNYYIYITLCKKYNVKYVYINSFFASVFKKLFKILNLKYISELLFAFFISKRFEFLMSLYKTEYVLCICASEFLAFSNSNKKIIYLSDATYHLMFGYYLFALSPNLKKLYDDIEKFALNKSYKIIYSSKWAMEDAISHYSIDNNKIIVQKFGSNIEYNINLLDRNIKEKIKLLFVGVGFYRKGLDVAMNATNYLNIIDAGHKYVLNVVGINRDEINKNIDKIMNKNYDEYCIIYGKLYKNNKNDLNKIIDLYKSSNLFILPTRAECAGIVFCESSMFCLPIIARATGGVKDYVINGINGYTLQYECNYKDYANKILEIINNSKLYKDLQTNAYKLYKDELNWDKWLNDFDEIINCDF